MRPSKPSFKEAFLFWLQLGFISFGGPAGQIAIMHRFLVEKKKWISESKFLHALNYCMLLPGPEAQQMAIYSGWLLHGRRGGLIAGVLFVLPSTFILLILSMLYVSYGNLPAVSALFAGLKPAVLAIIFLALYKIGIKSLSTSIHFIVAALSFTAIFFFNIPFPLIIISAVIIGIAFQKMNPHFFISKNNTEKGTADEALYYINADSQTHTALSIKSVLRQFLITLFLWLMPFLLIRFFIADKLFWNSLCLFFTKAALVTFGGAYAILPYVAQVSVQKFHWLSDFQMLDGLALGETTPGPLIMVLAFVGFIGAYLHYGCSLFFGTLGLFTTVWFTFLPCFLFIFIGAPLIEKTQHNLKIKNTLQFISAAVAGVIFNLAIFLCRSVVFTNAFSFTSINWYNVFWIFISFTALHFFKVNIILWILISALIGLGYYAAFS